MQATTHGKDRALRLIGVASGLGAPAWAFAGCARGPEALRQAGIAAAVRRNGGPCRWEATLAPAAGPRYMVLPTLCRDVADKVATCLEEGDLPVVIGGDHAIAAGTWRGVARVAGDALGLLWIDAHLDANTPATSRSGNLHGMPLAALLGARIPELGAVDGSSLNPRHLCIVGARSYEEAEARWLRELGVLIFGMKEIQRRGLPAVLGEALSHVRNNNAAFGLSIDLDAIDPSDAPGVSTPSAGGLDGEELRAALHGIGSDPRLAAIEIAEFNPDHDPDGRTARLAVSLLESMTARQDDELRDWEAAYGANNYAPLPVVLSRGRGAYVWDTRGRRYLDLMSAYSATSFGHGHPRLLEVLTRQAQQLTLTSRAFHNDRLPLLLRRLHQVFGYDAALPVNTGVEAVETALKAARKWAYKVKGVAADRAEIIACAGNFHGRTIAAVAFSSEAQYRDGFGPFPPGLKCIPYGDAQALEAAITPQTAAFLVEPIQGENGIVVPPAGYLAACQEICRRHKVLLICDEVQSGLGRTGKLLACWHEDVRPDGVIIGKALGGGLLPVSAFLADRTLMQVFTPGDHGSTFGGNPLAAAVALEALDILVEEALSERAAELGAHLLQRLRAIDSPLIHEVRGRGLFVGIEVDARYSDARMVCLKLLEHGFLSKETHSTVVRIAPPLIVARYELDRAIDAIAETFAELEREFPRAA